MDLREIRYFLTVAEELNITRAAEKLHISQPPLSRAIMDLEEELNCTLMVRGKRKITLTPEGLALKRRGAQLLSLAEMTKEEITEMENGINGTLYLGLVEGAGPFLAADWLAGFKQLYPRVSYELWNGNADDLTDRLKEGMIELAITMEPFNREILDGFPVKEEPWVAIIPGDHPLSKIRRRTISPAELSDVDLIIPSRRSRRAEIDELFRRSGAEPVYRVMIAHSSNALELAAHGIGIAIFPASVGMDLSNTVNVTVKELRPLIKATYLLAWDKEKTLSSLAAKFIEFVQMSSVTE
ncbi:MAG: LysR family transcriptional regulator [Lachnospiraceae bacterium]|nr:LysR family transcriptional regulator [Lachnospiraceae bacterium]